MSPRARPEKSPAAFRTISEVAGDLDLPPHVLRFWESKFPQLKPLKRGGGRRYYRPEDILLLRRIRQCLYQDGYTIRGVQKLLGHRGDTAPEAGPAGAVPTLFPLDPAPDRRAVGSELPDATPGHAQHSPRTRRSHGAAAAAADQQTRAALEEIRRELLEARALLDVLLHGRKQR